MLFRNVTEVNAKTIKKLIEKASTEHTKIKNLYDRYCQTTEGVPILTRRHIVDGKEQLDKINNKIANDFVGEIVDMKVGFFCGVPISYVLNKDLYKTEKAKSIMSGIKTKVKELLGKPTEEKEEIISPDYIEHNQVIDDFNKYNSIPDLDVETTKRSTICGYCGRLPYIENKLIKIKLIDPWECIWIGDSIERPDYTIRYYDTCTFMPDGTEKTVSVAELYDSAYVTYYIMNDNKEYVEDPTKPAVKHFFGVDPLFGFANNDEMLGDCNKVISLIDAYDKMTSDMSSESEQWRLAYMIFKNCGIDAKTITSARQTGAFSVNGDNADAGFIIKDIPIEFQKYFLTLLENNIYRFAATPNMNDQNFSGDMTGIAIKNKFRPFEDKCKRGELKFKKSLQTEYEILTTFWRAYGIEIDPMAMDYVFTRNYPENKIEEAQFLRDTKGFLSEVTRFSHSSLVDNPEEEIRRLQEEEQENLDNFIAHNEMMKDTSDEDEEKKDATMQDDTKQAISNEAKE